MALNPPRTLETEGCNGSCPCFRISWTSTTVPSSITVCHCAECRSVTSANAPIAYGSLPNESLSFSNGGSSAFDAAQMPVISRVETRRAIRGTCERCGALIYMKYHCSPESTDMNMGLCSDDAALKRVRGATNHIFFTGQVGEGENSFEGFSEDMAQTVSRWESKGEVRRADA